MRNIYLSIIAIALITNKSYALVDYTPSNTSYQKSSNRSIDITNLKPSKKALRPVMRRNSVSKMFYVTTGYNSVVGDSKKFDEYSLGVTLMTPWKVYFDLDLSYGGGTLEEDELSLGNTEFSVGATWLEFGQMHNLISVDVIGGMSLGVKESDIGTQRSDSYVGLLTKKNFSAMDLSLGFEHWFMDEDKFENEYSIGSFNKYLVNAGWTVSRDIRFDLSFQFINIGDVEENRDISYTEVSPQLALKLSPGFNLNLGARFSSEKDISDLNLDKLKVWNVSSLYGNSFFTKMSFNF